MDKIEHYLDQVCRGIAGPRELRQHIRQELGEHLLDAAAEYRDAGLSPEQAQDRALEDFGGPEQVRAELQATHGHRALSIIIDKAMQWKEATMKTKWLATTWAHVALLGVIALQVLIVGGAVIFIMPKWLELYERGFFSSGPYGTDTNEAIAWSFREIARIVWLVNNLWWWLTPLIVLWAIFEWRVRSEHKSMIRLSMLGTIGFIASCVSIITAWALILPAAMAMPAAARHRHPTTAIVQSATSQTHSPATSPTTNQ